MLLINFGFFVVLFLLSILAKISLKLTDLDVPQTDTPTVTLDHKLFHILSHAFDRHIQHTLHVPVGFIDISLAPYRVFYTSKPTHLKSISKFWRVQSPSHGAHFFLVESMKQPTQKIKDTHAARGTLSTPADDTHPSCPAQYSFLLTGYHPHSTWFCIFNALLDLDYTSLYFNEVECGGDV